MNLLDKISQYVDAIFWVTMITLIVAVVLYIYFFRIRKITAKEERVNYDRFQRKDATEFIKIENVLTDVHNSTNGMGVIGVGNNVYVAGLNIAGYNFNTASSEERQRTMINAISMANVIERPVQFRQSVKGVDLSANIAEHEAYHKKIAEKIFLANDEKNAMIARLNDNIDNIDEVNEIERRLTKLDRQLDTLAWKDRECAIILNFLRMRSDKNNDAQKVNQLMFSYKFDSKDYTEELTKEEIELRATEELYTQGLSLQNAIEACGCNVSRLSNEELLGLIRRHNAPSTADDCPMEDLFNSSYLALFTTSDSLIELERAKQSEEEYIRIMEQLQAERVEMIRKQSVERERNALIIERELASKTDEERQGGQS